MYHIFLMVCNFKCQPMVNIYCAICNKYHLIMNKSEFGCGEVEGNSDYNAF